MSSIQSNNKIIEKESDCSYQTRNQSIDLIKIIAMFGVLGLHVFIGRTDYALALLLDNNVPIIAMPLFIMVSGYLLSTKNEISVRYIIRKVCGIVKFVTTIILIYGISMYLMGGGKITPNDFIYPYFQLGPFGIFWYFGTMCILYVTSPLLIKIVNQSYIRWILIIYPILLAIIFIMDFYFDLESHVIQSCRIYVHAYYFMLGAYVYKERAVNIRFLAVLGSLLFLELFVYVIRYFHADCFFRVSYFYNSIPCIVASYLLFVYIAGKRIEGNKVIAFLSNLFLPFYTIHFLLIRKIEHWSGWGLFGYFNPLIEYIVVALACILISWVLMNNRLTKWIFKI